jgi:hypothetical protein
MKTKFKNEKNDDLRSEYDLGKLLKEGIQGKYATRYREGTNIALLAPDVAELFPTDEAVNEALRLVIRLTKIPAAARKTAPTI